MQLISALLFGISANMDAFVVGFSYGIKQQRIPFLTNMIISLITFLGTFLSIGIGLKAAAFLPGFAAQIAGSMLLIVLGLYYCFKYFYEKARQKNLGASAIDAPSKVTLSKKEAALLGLTLTANNAGMGIGASFAGTHFLLTSLVTLFFCAGFLITGNLLGRRWAPAFIKRYATLFSGLIIAILGIWELLG